MEEDGVGSLNAVSTVTFPMYEEWESLGVRSYLEVGRWRNGQEGWVLCVVYDVYVVRKLFGFQSTEEATFISCFMDQNVGQRKERDSPIRTQQNYKFCKLKIK